MIFIIIYCLPKLDNCPMKFRIGILFTLFNLATINGFSQSLNKVYSKSGLDYFTKVFETKDGYDAFGITSSFDIGFRDILFTKLDSCGEVVSSFAYGGIREENLVDVFQKTSGNYAVFLVRAVTLQLVAD